MAVANKQGGKKEGWNYAVMKRPIDINVENLISPSLYRLTEGIPRRELKQMVTESKACEDALELEIKQLEEALQQETPSSSDNQKNASLPASASTSTSDTNVVKKSIVDIMIESEVTPPDRFFTVSALLGRLRDDVATPLPPNSTIPALRSLHGLLQQPQKKKKTASSSAPTSNETSASEEKQSPLTDLDKQKRLLGLEQIPEYRKEQETTSALIALWKKISTHRTSVVFRRPVNPKEAPGYTDRIFFPMDLSLVRKMIVARMIKSYADLHQWIGLICHNCVKYNGRESDYGLVTREFEGVVDDFLVAAVTAAASAAGTGAVNRPNAAVQGNTATSNVGQNITTKNSAAPAVSAVKSAMVGTGGMPVSSATLGEKKIGFVTSDPKLKKSVPIKGVTKTG